MPEDVPLSAQPRHTLSLREGTDSLARQTLLIGDLPLPQLNKLRELRDALVALKGPLAEKPGLRERIEWALFNNEANDRMLGKVVCRPLDSSTNRHLSKPSGSGLQIHSRFVGECLDQRAAKLVMAQDQIE